MLAKRIIPCLDVDQGRVVKGVNFVGIRDAGTPLKLPSATTMPAPMKLLSSILLKSRTARHHVSNRRTDCFRGFYSPDRRGGVRSLDDIRRLLNAGADKVSINTAAITNPTLVADAAARFGSQCIVVAMDVKSTRRITLRAIYSWWAARNWIRGGGLGTKNGSARGW